MILGGTSANRPNSSAGLISAGRDLIDLHCHLLPGLDDGAPDLEMALDMARMAVADGISSIACTPHILPGVYPNSGDVIRAAVADLSRALDEAGIALDLFVGADVHLVPDLLPGIRSGRLPTLNGSRYFLLEPPHYVVPPRFEDVVFSLVVAGYVPIITHPERLSWLEAHYGMFQRLVRSGAWTQVTGGSLLGRFGRHVQYWAERMLGEGLVHLLASDAHNLTARRPRLAEARAAAARQVGEVEAEQLVLVRPQSVLHDASPADVASGSTTNPDLVSGRRRIGGTS